MNTLVTIIEGATFFAAACMFVGFVIGVACALYLVGKFVMDWLDEMWARW
jgi:hypothetical protein